MEANPSRLAVTFQNQPHSPAAPLRLAVPLAARTTPFQESVIREMTRLGDETGAVNRSLRLARSLPDYDSRPF